MKRFATSTLLMIAASQMSLATATYVQLPYGATVSEPVAILLFSFALLGFSALARRRLNREP